MTATAHDQMTEYEKEMLREYRANIIEECARAIDEAALEADNNGWSACDYAGYVRALKDKP